MKYLVVAILAFLSFSVSADSKFNFYLQGKAGQLVTVDPDGDTENIMAISPGLKFSIDLASRGSRVFFTYDYLTAELHSSTVNIGQDISGSSLGAGYEHKFPISRNFKLWLGGALSYNQHDFTGRHLIDDDGYLVETFEDRSVTPVGFSIYADTYFHISENFVFGIGGFGDFTSSDSVNLFGIRFSIGRE